MIEFKEGLLDRVRNRLTALPVAARKDVIDNDIGLIENQLQRYRRRLEYWYGRQWHLEGLSINSETRSVAYREQTVMLTKREYQLLVMLVMRSPRFTSAAQLLAEAWHDSRLPEESLRTYIGRVRSKLAKLAVTASIENKPRQGYALIFEETAPPQGHRLAGT